MKSVTFTIPEDLRLNGEQPHIATNVVLPVLSIARNSAVVVSSRKVTSKRKKKRDFDGEELFSLVLF